jgi:hypothetical protein
MSYFDNANNQVTRKSFGSKVDKEFKREGVIPVRDRNKDKVDKMTESANKFKELNKQVEARQLKEMKEKHEYDKKMQEGYKCLKEELIKEFISEICTESLLIDENAVIENFKNIVEMVEHKVDELGGFEGIKNIAETYKNPILLSMVSVCEATAKKVGERNAKEAKGCGSKVNFGLNKIELEEYDYRKKDMGSETIVNTIKDKVLQVVQDEQKMNSDKQMIMDDIQNKVSELNGPVEEAMKFIFEGACIEEDTLFNSIMRKQYKQLLETNSSPIFESFDYKELNDPLFEDQEFVMNDIELVDEEIDNEEIEDMFLQECNKLIDPQDELEFKEILESLYNSLVDNSQNITAKSQAKHYKSIVRKVQNELECIEEKYIINIQKHARKISDKKLDKSIIKWEQEIEQTRNKIKNEKDPVCLDDYREDLRTLEAELKALKAEKSHRGKQLKIAKEANPYMKSTMENAETVKNRLLKLNETTDDASAPLSDSEMKDAQKSMKDAASKAAKATEEVILCPKCGKEECNCKVTKESDDVLTEGIISDVIDKLDNLCENMNIVIEAHENAKSNVIESLTREINGETTLVPFLQTNDVNLNNLEFIYKTKFVCESLKNNALNLDYAEEAAVIYRAVNLNIDSINETLEVIKENEDMKYKYDLLLKGKGYLEKVKAVIERHEYESNDNIKQYASVFTTPEDVDKVFNQIKEYYVIESTNKDLMELVMAEAIVEYTILETFNTLNLVKYTKDSVRQMSRKNINAK